ncbi:SDR family NAD(P)-dependent oxidoreductase [Marinomonas mediterranea]|jgi:Dehydrogenases with different specificities (related to short-chain alcohol dehydrogenases)|uniref:3-oxoacyl-(Acyl-carrier-protein) reductase n=1 Tax=Marinomonas mediterranea (strain ATCC 700492 / JCM 21426 / NBRC 103028 / MMB-1) TaxID=717774 RepID=F2JZQ8_MARM1|nr:SDR family NAD(P)-dependent oxidoreductase [Marinomonas mediterranea]ADZ90912.1 3-oxoacyl-(acyl-carrier-protein) reductase [Marinomonas mediterranea MMB-1]WCN08956.1 SDR family oxidoreductase [Marinomonas mediterranea]WCN12988.1 SDR family oxidoreductase [Marinomonas mediterranea]WCN17057.1 SDR family oxidoreductase [Marinomonas mediterranea MMB-1]
MNKPLENRVAVITGAAGSIGREVCLKLNMEGAKLVLVDIDVESCNKLKDEIHNLGGNCIVVIGDLCSDGTPNRIRDSALNAFQRIDILINNAGSGSEMKPIWEMEFSDWERDIKQNLSSQFLMCKAIIPQMLKQSYGRIINVSSSAGMEGHALSGGYAAAKAGVIAMTKVLGKELAKTGVIVNTIAPAVIETKMLQKEWFNEDVKNSLLERIPMGRLGQPSEVAEMINFLASEKVSFTTGAVFDLSGGRATY